MAGRDYWDATEAQTDAWDGYSPPPPPPLPPEVAAALTARDAVPCWCAGQRVWCEDCDGTGTVRPEYVWQAGVGAYRRMARRQHTTDAAADDPF